MSQDEIMTREEAEELATQIQEEAPGIEVLVKEHLPPYVDCYYVEVIPCGKVVIKSPQQWRERKKYILKLRDVK